MKLASFLENLLYGVVGGLIGLYAGIRLERRRSALNYPVVLRLVDADTPAFRVIDLKPRHVEVQTDEVKNDEANTSEVKNDEAKTGEVTK
jgi:hypothetical protein